MHAAKAIFEKTLLHHLAQEFLVRYRFKYVLPRIQEITLDGLRLDVSQLSTKIRNRLLSGAYEAHEKEMCREFLQSEDCVLEIGGAIGFIGLFCQENLGIKEYFSFEANPRTFEILKRNYELNNIVPRAWNLALASEDGFVDLETGTDFWENSICYNSRCDEGVKTVKVPAGTLDTLVRKADCKPTALIVDIEGAEQFIKLNEIPSSVQKIIIELHPKVIGQELVYNLVAGFIGLGFRVAREDNDTFVFLRK